MIDVALRPRTILELCAGYGGLGLGVELASPGVRVVASVERQAYAAAVLASRMVEGVLDPHPIWDDLESFPCDLYRGKVDLVVAGFPCQGASVAGKRLGTADHRWLWPEVFRIYRAVEATWLLVENVTGLLSVNHGGAFEEILRDLESCGLAAEWDCISAGSCGAPHLRDRAFLLAADPQRVAVRVESERDQRKGGGEGTSERRAPESRDGGTAGTSSDTDAGGRGTSADADNAPEQPPQRARRAVRSGTRGQRGPDVTGSDQQAGAAQNSADADADDAGREGDGDGGELDAGVGPERGRDADRRSGTWSRHTLETVGRITDRGREHWDWQRAPEPTIAGVRGVDDGTTDGMGIDDPAYADKLHLLGNGAVPAAVGVAFTFLWDRLHGSALDVHDDER